MDTETLRELVAKATPGPWHFETDRSHFDSAAVVSSDGFIGANYYRRDADAHLVVTLLNTLPEIIAMMEREEAREAELAAVKAERDGLRSITSFIEHRQGCAILHLPDDHCDCGLDRARTALSKEPRT